MPLGFPQVIGIIAGATYGAVEQLPLQVAAAADNQTGILQVGIQGSVPVTGPIVVSSITSPVTLVGVGVGALFAVPAGTANGTLIGAVPAGATAIRVYIPAGATFTYTVAVTAPGAPPTNVVTVANPIGATAPLIITENINAQNMYVTAPTVANAALVARYL